MESQRWSEAWTRVVNASRALRVGTAMVSYISGPRMFYRVCQTYGYRKLPHRFDVP